MLYYVYSKWNDNFLIGGIVVRQKRIERMQKKNTLWKRWFKLNKKIEAYSYVKGKMKESAKQGKNFVAIEVRDVENYLASYSMGMDYQESREYKSYIYDVVVHDMQDYFKKRNFAVYFNKSHGKNLHVNCEEIQNIFPCIVIAWDVWSVERK